MKRKTAIVTIAYLGAAIALLGVYAALRKSGEEEAERAGRYAGEYAFEELCAACDGLSVALEKGSLTTSPGLEASHCADAYARSLSALTALGQLPFSTVEMENTSAFLGRTGDFARCLMRSSAVGQELSEKERESLGELADTAAWLSSSLKELRGEITEGLTCAGDCQEALFSLEKAFPTLSALRYDGSYTQAEKTFALLQGKSRCSEHEAALIAAGFIKASAQGAQVTGQGDGELPCWYVTLGDSAFRISQQGGQVVQFAGGGVPGEPELDEAAAVEAGDKFLREHGYTNMALIDGEMSRDRFVGTWCWRQGDVLCYPDEIRMAVSLSDGSVLDFDAEEYVSHHRQRELDTHTYAWEDARKALAPALQVREESLALIASPGGEEKLCLCFRCVREGEKECLVFCSAATGAQERIELL